MGIWSAATWDTNKTLRGSSSFRRSSPGPRSEMMRPYVKELTRYLATSLSQPRLSTLPVLLDPSSALQIHARRLTPSPRSPTIDSCHRSGEKRRHLSVRCRHISHTVGLETQPVERAMNPDGTTPSLPASRYRPQRRELLCGVLAVLCENYSAVCLPCCAHSQVA